MVNAYPGFTAAPQQAHTTAHVTSSSRSGRTVPQHDYKRHPQSGGHDDKRHPQSGRTGGHDDKRRTQSGRTAPQNDKRYTPQTGRKKPEHKKMDSYSSDSSNAGWSNY
jgi:hypothetical protein